MLPAPAGLETEVKDEAAVKEWYFTQGLTTTQIPTPLKIILMDIVLPETPWVIFGNNFFSTVNRQRWNSASGSQLER